MSRSYRGARGYDSEENEGLQPLFGERVSVIMGMYLNVR